MSINLETIRVKAVRGEKQILYINIYVESRKMLQMNLFAKQKPRHRYRKQMYEYQAGKKG